jgi:TPR repeat protein
MAHFHNGAAAVVSAEEVGVEDYFDLGLMFSTDREEAADLIAAHKWFNLAAINGNSEAARYRQEIAQEMSPADVAEAQRAAREWLRTRH